MEGFGETTANGGGEGGCRAFQGEKSKEKTTRFLCQRAKIPAASWVSNFAGKGTGKGRITEENQDSEQTTPYFAL